MDQRRRAHAIDMYMLDHAQRAFPDHAITVVNKWGVAVCGSIPANAPTTKAVLTEVRERDWQVELQSIPLS